MNKACRILIIEDEFLIALNLQEILTKEGFEVVGIASSYKGSIALCKSKSPDITLVDINIDGDRNGIETAAFLKDAFGVAVIFLTAYTSDEFFEAAKQIKPEAYLTKPFDAQDVIRTVKLCAEKITTPDNGVLQNNQTHLILNTGDGWQKVQIEDIVYIGSDNNYCTFHLCEGADVLVHKSLKHFEEELARRHFYRCHQSYLINMKFLQKIEKKDGLQAVLKGDFIVPVSRNRRPELMDLFLL